MKSREISRSKIGPFSLACTDPYIGIGWEYQFNSLTQQLRCVISTTLIYTVDRGRPQLLANRSEFAQEQCK